MSAAYEYGIDLAGLERDERALLAAARRLRRAAAALERASARADRTARATTAASAATFRPRPARRR